MLDQEHKARVASEEKSAQLEESQRRLQEAKEAADTANRTKSDFLASMSHELRTPLNAIIGYSELIYEELSDSGQMSVLPDVTRISQAGNHLLQLINDILDLSRIEAGKMTLHLENFQIRALVDNVASTIRPLVAKNKNQITIDCPSDIGSMFADETKVRQTLLNLLSNACKFTEHGTIAPLGRPTSCRNRSIGGIEDRRRIKDLQRDFHCLRHGHWDDAGTTWQTL